MYSTSVGTVTPLQLFREAVSGAADSPAISNAQRTWTYAELDRWTDAIAHRLTAAGVSVGDFVVVVASRCAEMLAAELALVKIGAVFVPVEAGNPAARVRFIVRDTAARAVVLCGEPTIEHWAPTSSQWADGVHVETVSSATPFRDAIYQPIHGVPDDPTRLSYCIYTSGTTGKPKGVLIEGGSLVNFVQHCLTPIWEDSGSQRLALVSSFAFDMSMKTSFGALLTGRHVRVIAENERDDVAAFVRLLSAERIDAFDCTPSYLRAVRSVVSDRGEVPRLKGVLVGGESLDLALAQDVFALTGATVYNMYGPTEATIDATYTSYAGQQLRRLTVGHPFNGVDVAVVKGGRRLATGLLGEIWIGGRGVARGYLNRPELTEEKFVTDPFGPGSGRYYRTGDLGRVLPSGEIDCHGRMDAQVKLHGYRIELEEIERAIDGAPGILAAAAAVLNPAAGEQVLVGYYTADDHVDEDELRAWLGERLPHYMVPSVFMRLAELPLTRNGKLDRKALPTPSARCEADTTSPRSEVEAVVVEALEEVLGCSPIGVLANFFEVGGDSIKAILVVSALARRGLRISVRDIMASQTAARMAVVARPDVQRPAALAPATGEVPATAIVADFFSRALPQPQHHHQSMAFPVSEADLPLLPAAWAAVLGRHLILSGHVRDGRLVVPANPAPNGLHHWALQGLQPHEFKEEAGRRADELCRATDLASGPLAWGAVLRGDKGVELLVCAHHLVIDALSWRAIRNSLKEALDLARQGAPVVLSPEQVTFRQWACALESVEPRALDRAHWARTAANLPPRPESASASTAPRLLRADMLLPHDVTERLVATRRGVGDPDLEQVLLAAVAGAARRVWHVERIGVRMEGHGRDHLDGLPDATGAVGWFTSRYPVALDTCEDRVEQLLLSRQELMSVPSHGMTWGLVEVEGAGSMWLAFNYMGDVSGDDQRSLNPYGQPSAPENLDSALVSVDAMFNDGQLEIQTRVRSEFADQATLVSFVRAVRAEMVWLAGHVDQWRGRVTVPADHPEADLTLPEFQAIAAALHGARVDTITVCTPLQEGLLFERLSNETATSYSVQASYDFAAAPDARRVRQVLELISEGNPLLRAAIVWENLRRPHQVILTDRRVETRVIDLRHLPAEEQAERMAKENAAQLDRLFDLSADPLIRCDVFHLSDSAQRVVFTNHHVILDGWSMAELCRQFADLHERLGRQSFALVRESHLAERGRAASWQDYVHELGDRDAVELDAHWARILDGYRGSDRVLPSDAPHGALGEAGRVERVTRDALGKAVAHTAAAHQVTVSSVVEAAWGIVVAHLTGSDDVVFGKVVSGRDIALPGVEQTLGLFINTVPTRVRVRGAGTLAELMRETQKQAIDAAGHDHCPLVEVLRAGGDISINTLYAFENYFVGEETAQFPRLEFVAAQEQTNYDLTLTVEYLGDELGIDILFDAGRYAYEDVSRIIDRLVRVLEQMTAEPQRPVDRVSTLLAGELECVTQQFNATSTDYPRDASVGELFAAQVQRTPDAIALAGPEAQLSYAQLAEQASRVAATLWGLGVSTGDCVGLLAPASAELFIGLLGIVMAGAVYVPLDVEAPPARTQFVLADSAARVVLTGGSEARALAATAGMLPAGAAAVAVEDAIDGRLPIASAPALGPSGGDPVYVMYTSGTTGRPKGSLIAHRAVVRLVVGNESLRFGPDDVMLQTGALSFDASTLEIWGMWLNGGALVHAADREDILTPERLRQLVRRHGVTAMWLTASLFNQIVSLEPNALDGVTRIWSGGEKLSPEHVAMLYAANPDVLVINGYGPTENTTFTTTHPIPRGCRDIPIGRPISNTTCHVLDGTRVCGIGEVGELVTGGDGVSLGYLNNPELTAERFISNPYGTGRLYRTGDLVRWLPDGTLDFLGRRDEQVKVRGFRIEPNEVASALQQLPHVRDAIVVARKEPNLTTALAGYLVADEPLDIAAVRMMLADFLPGYMIPTYLMQIPQVPLTRNGKADVRALPEMLQPVTGTRQGPETPAEEAACMAVAEVLGLDEVGVNDDFFALGGDSVKAIRVVAKMRQTGHGLTVSAVMRGCTPRGIAALTTTQATTQRFERSVGRVGSVPILDEFFRLNLPAPAHFNQDVVVPVGEHSRAEIEQALDALWEQHDALRAVVRDDALWLPAPDAAARFGFEAVTVDSEEHRALALTDCANRAHGSMNLSEGPLFHAALVLSPGGGQLVMCAHHLVIDGVSWRILVDDLLSVLSQLKRGESIALPARTASLIDWATALERNREAWLVAEATHWDTVDARSGAAALAVPHPVDGQATDVLHFESDLAPAVTEELARTAATAHHGEVRDVLVAALGLAVARLTGQPELAIRLEGHGRDGWPGMPPVDRTVGWFTSVYPAILPCPTDPGEAVIAAKEMLRAVPANGLGYGLRPGGLSRLTADVSFNYLGDLSERDTDIVFNATGESADTRNRMWPGTTLNVHVRAGRFHLGMLFEPATIDPETAHRLADEFGRALTEIVRHGCDLVAAGRIERTPSDFSAAELSRGDLTRLVADLRACRAIEVESEIEDVYDLTPLQAGMVFHDGDNAYVVQHIFGVNSLQEPLDPQRLADALTAVGRRHSALRAALVHEGLERPRQVVLSGRGLELTYIDLRTADRPMNVDELAAAELARGIDIAREPLLRTVLVTDANGRHHLMLTYHHAILDGWSLGLILGDLDRYHQMLTDGQSPEDVWAFAEHEAAGAPSFGEFAQTIAGRDLTATRAHWNDLLSGYEGCGEFSPAEPADRVGDTGRVEFDTTGQLAQRLSGVASAYSTTLSTIVEAAWGLVLQRANGCDDVVFGKIVSGRDHADAETVVGLFINTIPVRVLSSAGQSFDDLLRDLRAQTTASLAHDYAALADIQRWVDRPDLVRTLYTFENFSFDDTDPDGELRLEFERVSERTNYPLSLAVQERGNELNLTVLHDPSRFASTEVERILRRLEEVLHQVAENPASSISELTTLLPGEREKLLTTFNDTAVAFPRGKFAPDFFLDAVDHHPDAPALLWDGGELSFRQTEEAAWSIVAELREAGVGPGTAVALMGDRGPALIVAMLAAWLGGHHFVPCDVTQPVGRLRHMVSDCEVKAACVVGSSAAELCGQDGMLPVGTPVIDVGDLDIRLAGSAGRELRHRSTPSDLAYIIYTSGTTGVPKGVMLTHRGLANFRNCQHHIYEINDTDRVLQFANLSFDAAVSEVTLSLLCGAGLVCTTQEVIYDPDALAALMAAKDVSVAVLPPQYFLQLESLRLRVLSTAGSAATPAIVRKAQRCGRYVNAYGPTENTVQATTWDASGVVLRDGARVPIGRPTPNSQVHIVSGMRLCGVGEFGELCIAGEGLALGYVNRPELTAAKFVSNPFGPGRLYRSGDLARWLPDGNIEFAGRIDDQVKIRGFRIELGEVENALQRISGVMDAVVIAEATSAEAVELRGFVVGPRELDLSSVRAQLGDLLPHYMVPAQLTQIPQIPLNRNGKVDKGALPKSAPREEAASAEPASAAERVVCEAFAEVLGVSHVSPADSFLELGGDSIKAIRVVSRLRRTGYDLTAPTVMQHVTPRMVARHVRACEARHQPRGEVRGRVDGLPIIDAFFGWNLAEPAHFNQELTIELGACREASVRAAVEAVWEHHDALRAVVEGNGLLIRGVAEGPAVHFESHPVTDVDARARTLGAVAAKLHRSMDLAEGPLFKAAWVVDPVGGTLLLCAHHLVIDGVSWRILADDLTAAVRRAEAHESVDLSPPSASLIEWAAALDANRERIVAEEHDHWNEVEARAVKARLPRAACEPGVLEVELDAGLSKQILGTAGAAHRTDAQDLLLAGLTMAVRDVTGNAEVSVRLEGHGRVETAGLPPIDRTVGWFTTEYPVVLPCETDPRRALILVKELLRKVPNAGFGYGLRPGGLGGLTADIAFNYLGEIEDFSGAAVGFNTTGQSSSRANQIGHGLAINVLVHAGRVRLQIGHDGTVLGADGVVGLVRQYERRLGDLTGHCAAVVASGHIEPTAADRSAVGLHQAEYERILDLLGVTADAVDDIYGLTPLQSGMLFHALENPDSAAYILQQVFAVDGLSEAELHLVPAALEALVLEHPVLRTAVVHEGLGQPWQVVLTDRRIDFSVVEADEDLPRLLRADVERGFDLVRSPLLRVTAIRPTTGSADRLRLVWTYHHIIVDGWCLSTVLGAFKRHLRSLANGRTPAEVRGQAEIESLRVPSYASYVAWLAQRDQSELTEYWGDLLSGYEGQGRITPAQDPDGTAGEVVRLGRNSTGSLADRLIKVSGRRGSTLSTMVEAAWGLVLMRASNERDVVFGKVVSGRDVPIDGIDRTVGMFINTIPVRVRVNDETTVDGLIASLRDQAIASSKHDYGSLADVQRLAGRDTIIHTLYAFENYLVDDEAFRGDEGLRLSMESSREQTNYELNLTVQQVGEELRFVVLYDPGCYAAAEVSRILDRVLTVLDQLAKDEQQRVDDLRSLLQGEEQKVVEAFNGRSVEYPRELSAVDVFTGIVDEYPERPALMWGDQNLTYREFEARCLSVAASLRAAGVCVGSAVGILCERGPEAIVALMGTLLAGACYVPFDVEHPAERIRHMAHDINARAMLIQGRRAASACAREGTLPQGCAVIDVAEALTPGSPAVGREIMDGHRPGSGHLAYIIYTSGTTGVPKGVMLGHRGLVNFIYYLRTLYEQNVNDRVLQFANLTFDASVWELALSLFSGGTLVLIDKETVFDVGKLEVECRDKCVTLALLPPQYLLQTNGLSLRVLTTGGSAANAQVLHKAASSSSRYVNAYGPTENTVMATAWDASGVVLRDGARVPIGRPTPNSQVHIVSGMRLCGVGEFGELCIAGEGLALGYVNRPELTAAKFVSNPFGPGRLYRSGDLARWLPDGNIEFAGRIDDQVKIRGFRIELGEVENALRSVPEVRDAVVATHDGPDGLALVGYVVADTPVDAARLRTELAARVPGYMVPAHLVQISQIPLNRSGKPDKRALPPVVVTEAAPMESPRSSLEDFVAGVWCRVLGRASVGVKDNFFEIGGNSLSLMKVFNKINQRYPDEITMGDLFAWATVSDIASGIERRRNRALTINRYPLESLGGSVGGDHRLPKGASHTGRRLLRTSPEVFGGYAGLAYWMAMASLSSMPPCQLLIEDADGLVSVEVGDDGAEEVMTAVRRACGARSRVPEHCRVRLSGEGTSSVLRLPGGLDKALPALVVGEIDWCLEIADIGDSLTLRVTGCSQWAPHGTLGVLVTRTAKVLDRLLSDHVSS